MLKTNIFKNYFHKPRMGEVNQIILKAMKPFACLSGGSPSDTCYNTLQQLSLAYSAAPLLRDATWPFILAVEANTIPTPTDWRWIRAVYTYVTGQITKSELLLEKPVNLPQDSVSLKHLLPWCPAPVKESIGPLTFKYIESPGRNFSSNIMFSGIWPMGHGKFPKGHPCRNERKPTVGGASLCNGVYVPGEQPKSKTNLGKFRARGYCFHSRTQSRTSPLVPALI